MTDQSPAPVTPESIQPVSGVAPEGAAGVKPGIALCLSGGGYRAMIFHLGALWRMNQLGFLKKLDRVSSVSGGSITAGVLALAWKNLQFNENGVATNLEELVIKKLRRFANNTIDQGSIIKGILMPRHSISDEITEAYRDHLFGNATLRELPADNEGPRFIINATNVQSKVLWRFSRPYMGDYRVGLVNNPTTEIALAVAASSAFPPFLSPALLELEPSDFDPNTPAVLKDEAYRSNVVLTDGGVYDNLGLETAWKSYKTILVSDGGGATADEPDPDRDWARHSYRILSLIDNQVRSLRKRQVIDSYVRHDREGTYWGIRTNIADYGLPDAMNCPFDETMKLANVATRLKALDATVQERIINWGYAVCDAALRKHVDQTLPPPVTFPYPASGV
ncbi:MAG TPA: patatin-like phospholipase family protein [Pyrinomonadaceae bacterium]|jgi:NTE family protein|nr:patatin-like phospholipase family protein [Pyrinomonadaceae bacterium]